MLHHLCLGRLNFPKLTHLFQSRSRKKLASWLLLGLLLTIGPITQRAEATIPQAKTAARTQQLEHQIRQVHPDNYDLRSHPVINAKEKHWRNILWTTALVEPSEPYVTQAIDQILALTAYQKLSDPQMRTIDMAMQVGTQLYLSDPVAQASLGQRFVQTIAQSPDPQWVAMSLSALTKAGLPSAQVQALSNQVRRRFPKWSNNIHLYTTLRDVEEFQNPSPVPPLSELLNWTIAPNQIHLYVICQPDRGSLCQAVVKDKQGNFVYQNGELWSVPLLLRSLHGLRWNFVRGQTPQGIYRMEGVVPQPDLDYFRAYGQFDLVKLFVPFESGAKEFLPGRKGPFTGNLNNYKALLPPSWRQHFPIQQTYWAGKAERSEFRIHGTGDDPGFFFNNRRYPSSAGWNPTIGCLSAIELYDGAGNLQQADMPKILGLLRQLGGPNFAGYVVVVEIPGQLGQSVSRQEIEAVLSHQARQR